MQDCIGYLWPFDFLYEFYFIFNFIFIKLVIFKTKFCWNFSWDLSKYIDELSTFTDEFEDNCPLSIVNLPFHEYLLSFKLY